GGGAAPGAAASARSTPSSRAWCARRHARHSARWRVTAGSASPSAAARSAPSSAWYRSATVHLRELAQPEQARPDAGLGRPERDVLARGDLRRRAAAEDGVDDRPGLLRGHGTQPRDRLLRLEAVRDGLLGVRDLAEGLLEELVEDVVLGRAGPPRAHDVDRGVPRDGEQPGE